MVTFRDNLTTDLNSSQKKEKEISIITDGILFLADITSITMKNVEHVC